jgi:hypothetical protein
LIGFQCSWVGGQIGYRRQSAGWVFGLEAQGDRADLTGSNVSVFVPAWTNNSKIEAFGLFTGQVGYPPHRDQPRWLTCSVVGRSICGRPVDFTLIVTGG